MDAHRVTYVMWGNESRSSWIEMRGLTCSCIKLGANKTPLLSLIACRAAWKCAVFKRSWPPAKARSRPNDIEV